MSIARSGAVETVVVVPPEAVWQVVVDVTRTGEWSHECHRVTWQRGTTRAVPGARFRGYNRSGRLRWSRACELTTVDPPREIAWRTLRTALFPDSTDWRIQLEPADSGTRVRLSYQVTCLPSWYDRILGVLNPLHADRTPGLAADLQRLGDVAAAGSTFPSAAG